MTTRGPVYIHGEVNGIFTEKSVKKSLLTFYDNSFVKLNYASFFNGFNNTILNCICSFNY